MTYGAIALLMQAAGLSDLRCEPTLKKIAQKLVAVARAGRGVGGQLVAGKYGVHRAMPAAIARRLWTARRGLSWVSTTSTLASWSQSIPTHRILGLPGDTVIRPSGVVM